jgi:Protein of unknown function (DUF2442)
MLRPKEIVAINDFKITFKFNNEEVGIIDLEKVLPRKDRFSEKILNPEIFNQVKIGFLGQFYWENMAEMKDEKGKIISCEYDLSPEFIYHHSFKFNS